MRKEIVTFALIFAASALLAIITNLPGSSINDDLPFVKDMDFKRFMGVWYSIASLPNFI